VGLLAVLPKGILEHRRQPLETCLKIMFFMYFWVPKLPEYAIISSMLGFNIISGYTWWLL
jgi:hypothetical protein